jgi:hypothetical protein
MNRLPWLPDRLLDHALPSTTIQQVLERAARAAARFEHLVSPRILGLTATPAINAVNGAVVVIAVLLLMAPLPLIPFANTLPAIGIILLCLGMAERDGAMILLGYAVSLVATLYVGVLLWLAAKAGGNLDVALVTIRDFLQRF